MNSIMLDSITKAFKKILGNKADRDLKDVSPYVGKILAESEKLTSISNDELRGQSAALKETIRNSYKETQDKIDELKKKADDDALPPNEKEKLYEEIDKLEKKAKEQIDVALDEALPLAFAIVKETAKRFSENEKIEVTATEMDRDLAATRNSIEIVGDKAIWDNSWDAAGYQVTWEMIHYDVQLIGGTILHQGKIAEMQTGEGKTLVSTLPVFLNALSGKGVHVVTVNDYLAKRDSEWMGPMHEFHGLTVDCIDKHRSHSEERRAAYRADVTYGTNNEFGFDYLRDNMSNSPNDLVQRPHNYAIVDEVDSVLIDDARTPLIISGPTPRGDQHEFNELKPKIEKLVRAQRNLINTVLADAKKMLTAEESGDKKRGGKIGKRGWISLVAFTPWIAKEQSAY